jgi:SAM-dependent methyltransferase
MKLINFMDKNYPEFLAQGNHAQYILPIAKQVLKNKNLGVDVGCKKAEWAFPGAILADIELKENPWHANYLPREGELEYIFSSHCLEHIENWVETLLYWKKSLVSGGIIFLYLPHTDCEYWDTRFMTTRRHVNNFTSEQLEYYFKFILGLNNVFASKRDSAFSFCVYGEKP